jgi:hypothetical protein
MGEAKDGEGCLGCAPQKWASYQELLLSMTTPTVGEIVAKINSDPTWDDPIRVAHLVESVAGARRNDQALILFASLSLLKVLPGPERTTRS